MTCELFAKSASYFQSYPKSVVQFAFRPVRLFQPFALDIILAVCHVKPVLPRKFLADTGTAQPLVPVRNDVAAVVNAVEGDMHVRMFLVGVSGDEELRTPDTHPFHVFKRNACHDTVRQTWLVLFGETQRNVSDRFRHLAIHLPLDVETYGDGVLVFHKQALGCHYLRILILVDYVAHHTFEVASLCDFCHHIPILLMSSLIIATATLQSQPTSEYPPEFALHARWSLKPWHQPIVPFPSVAIPSNTLLVYMVYLLRLWHTPEIMAYRYHGGIYECYASTSPESSQINPNRSLET